MRCIVCNNEDEKKLIRCISTRGAILCCEECGGWTFTSNIYPGAGGQ